MFKHKFLFVFLFLFIIVMMCVSILGKRIEKKLSLYVEEEVNRVSNILIRDVLNDDFLKELKMDDLFSVMYDSDDVIDNINFNTVEINRVLGKINDEVIYYFDQFDRGNVDIFYESKLFKRYDGGVYLNVSLGNIFKNPIIYNLGPKIPIKLLFSGDVESNLVTSVKEYGINMILLEVDIEIRVTEKIIFPFSNKYVKTVFNFPLIIEIISGKIPEGYINNEKFGIME